MFGHENKHVLLIVDIQKKYEQYFNLIYLQKVYRYMTKHSFAEIRALIDTFPDNPKGDYIPTFIANRLTHEPIFKQYSSQLPAKLLKEAGFTEYEIKRELFHHKGYCPFKGGLLVLLEPNYIPDYRVCHGEILEHYHLEYLPQSFKEFLINCQGNKVHLVGGGYNECVRITKKILDLFHIQNIIHARVCYEINSFSSLAYSPLPSEIDKYHNRYLDQIYNRKLQEVYWTFKENASFPI